MCLAVWIAVKHFRELRQHSTGGIIVDCFMVLMQTHVSYFARGAHSMNLVILFGCGMLICHRPRFTIYIHQEIMSLLNPYLFRTFLTYFKWIYLFFLIHHLVPTELSGSVSNHYKCVL
jgi:hypothetical protein